MRKKHPTGRPPLPPAKRRVRLDARVRPDTKRRLQSEGRRTGKGLGDALDRLAENLKDAP